VAFDVKGTLEWLPQETIVFDGALADMECEVNLGPHARYIGWEILCLGRTGSGERFAKGRVNMRNRISRNGKPLWFERGSIAGGGTLMRSPVGLGGKTVVGTFIAASDSIQKEMISMGREKIGHSIALTLLPGVLIGRYLGDSSEEAMNCMGRLWAALRPVVAGREAIPPRIWST
jgi:urease accessory protein